MKRRYRYGARIAITTTPVVTAIYAHWVVTTGELPYITEIVWAHGSEKHERLSYNIPPLCRLWDIVVFPLLTGLLGYCQSMFRVLDNTDHPPLMRYGCGLATGISVGLVFGLVGFFGTPLVGAKTLIPLAGVGALLGLIGFLVRLDWGIPLVTGYTIAITLSLAPTLSGVIALILGSTFLAAIVVCQLIARTVWRGLSHLLTRRSHRYTTTDNLKRIA